LLPANSSRWNGMNEEEEELFRFEEEDAEEEDAEEID
jgi:hypothetical protein